MNRRNFLGLAPVGVVGIAALAKGSEPETEVMKTDTITIQGPDGKHYSPLLVEATDTSYKSISRPMQSFATHSFGVERARIKSNGEVYDNNVMSITTDGMLGIR